MGIFIKPQAPSGMASALFPKVRQRVLAVLFGNPNRSFYANEVIALAQSGTGAVQRELATLSEAGLLNVKRQGNQKHYQANADALVYAELRGLVLKTMGLADVLRAGLVPLAPQVKPAFHGQRDVACIVQARNASAKQPRDFVDIRCLSF